MMVREEVKRNSTFERHARYAVPVPKTNRTWNTFGFVLQ
jgi:hypothetical protein